MLVTATGGGTWAPQTVAGCGGSNLWSVWFSDTSNGWADGDGPTMVHTTNGGTSWSTQSAGGLLASNRTVAFADSSHGVAGGQAFLGGGTAFNTTNSGANWNTSTLPGGLGTVNASAFPAGGTTAWLAGTGGAIETSTDSGATFSTQTSGTASNLLGLSAPNACHAWAVGASGTVDSFFGQPTVTAVSPSTAGTGVSITITGTCFVGATAVKFGSTAATFTVGSDTSITATVPSGSGTVDITVTGPGGTSTSSSSDQFTYGFLSIGSLSNTSLPAVALNAGSTSGPVDSGIWGDTTASGAGWHGLISTSTFQAEGPWAQTAGVVTALGSTASGSYSGGVANALITVTVNSGGSGANTPFAWSDREGATTSSNTVSTCGNGGACAVSNGVTINFASGTSYPSGAVYVARVGTLPAGAMILHVASAATITPQSGTLGGANLPTYESDGNTVSGGGVGVQGASVAFVSAATNQGEGSFTLAPGVTVTWDPNLTWNSTAAAAFTAVAQYTIVSGP
jgi:hypothetical protein